MLAAGKRQAPAVIALSREGTATPGREKPQTDRVLTFAKRGNPVRSGECMPGRPTGKESFTRSGNR